MDEMKRISDAVNRGNVVVNFDPGTFLKKELSAPPRSFYEYFGWDADPWEIFNKPSKQAAYIQHVIGSDEKVKISKAYLSQLIADGYEDVRFLHKYKMADQWNSTLDHCISAVCEDGSARLSCAVTTDFGKIDLCGENRSLYQLARFHGVASHITVPGWLKKLEIWPKDIPDMVKSYQEGRFFQHYGHYGQLVESYDKEGVFDRIKLNTPIMGKPLAWIVHNRVIATYTYRTFAPVCEHVENLGGTVAFYRPFSMIILVPQGVNVSDIEKMGVGVKMW